MAARTRTIGILIPSCLDDDAWNKNILIGVTAEYPATLTALLKNRGYSVRSVWGNNLKCSKAVLGAGYAVRGMR